MLGLKKLLKSIKDKFKKKTIDNSEKELAKLKEDELDTYNGMVKFHFMRYSKPYSVNILNTNFESVEELVLLLSVIWEERGYILELTDSRVSNVQCKELTVTKDCRKSL